MKYRNVYITPEEMIAQMKSRAGIRSLNGETRCPFRQVSFRGIGILSPDLKTVTTYSPQTISIDSRRLTSQAVNADSASRTALMRSLLGALTSPRSKRAILSSADTLSSRYSIRSSKFSVFWASFIPAGLLSSEAANAGQRHWKALIQLSKISATDWETLDWIAEINLRFPCLFGQRTVPVCSQGLNRPTVA